MNSSNYQSPANDLERCAEGLASLFRSAFQRDAVTADDDFFGLGGDSFIATELMIAIEKQFGVALSIATLLEAPTPRKLAAMILASKAQQGSPWVAQG